jgi:hypothetical protein
MQHSKQKRILVFDAFTLLDCRPIADPNAINHLMLEHMNYSSQYKIKPDPYLKNATLAGISL